MRIELEPIAERFLPSKYFGLLKPVLQRADEILTGQTDNARTQRIALIVFAIRIASAFITFVSQIILARWLGEFNYGVFVAVWVAVLIVTTISCIGFPSAVVRYIAEYQEKEEFGLMRGVIRASIGIVAVSATTISAFGFFVLYNYPQLLAEHFMIPALIGAIYLPMLALENVMGNIARAFNWPMTAYLPVFVFRPVGMLIVLGIALIAGFAADAETALWSTLIAAYTTTISKLIYIIYRLRKVIVPEKPEYKIKTWFLVAAPIFLVEGFYVLHTSIDVLFVSYLVNPEETAIYFASVKILALVHFVYFAVRSTAAPKYAALNTAGDMVKFQQFVQTSVSWTFCPTLFLALIVCVLGKFILMLFGDAFTAGYSIVWILALGIVLRSAVGPAESLLVMAGGQIACASIYAVTFSVNIALNLALIPIYGIEGAAIATACAFGFESLGLYVIANRLLGIHAFVIPRREHATGEVV
ncbi:MAG: oligosaccharide flippase family protein [Pseudomonadota bacterium]